MLSGDTYTSPAGHVTPALKSVSPNNTADVITQLLLLHRFLFLKRPHRQRLTRCLMFSESGCVSLHCCRMRCRLAAVQSAVKEALEVREFSFPSPPS